jgi:hypothetical protein
MKPIHPILVALILLTSCNPTPNATSIPTATSLPDNTPIPTTTPIPTPILTATPVPTRAPVIRVGGSGEYTTIQSAILAAQDGDTIQVAQGVYEENITIEAPKTLILEGGWDAEFTSRSDDSSSTIIDGMGMNSVLFISVEAGMNLNLTIDGFTIQNGNGQFGGGISADTRGTNSSLALTLKNNTITGSKAAIGGGGISAGSLSSDAIMSLTLVNNVIDGNETEKNGGGISIRAFGGLIETVLEGNTISENLAGYFGSGIEVNCGEKGSIVANFTNNTITGNAVTDPGGGGDGGGIAVYCADPGSIAQVSMVNNVFTENSAGSGGGIFGSALGDASSVITLTNNIIYRNTSHRSGGGIFSLSGAPDPDVEPGGQVTWRLTNNTITSNVSKGHGAGFGSNSAEGGSTSITSHSDIIWGNYDPNGSSQIHVGVFNEGSGDAAVHTSFSGIGSVLVFNGATYDSDNVIAQDPLFVDPANGDFSLQDGSPAIDMGDPEHNDGCRPPGKGTARADLGAYGGAANCGW